jgi:hypothetical protein
MANLMATQITASHESWTDFLKTAARLYKYLYHEQFMTYVRRPGATACTGYELWDEKMRKFFYRFPHTCLVNQSLIQLHDYFERVAFG